MDRLISEQAVIESIEFFQMNPQNFDFVNLIDDIKEIPSAEQRWIPVSERLPDKNGRYLVTVKQGYITFGTWVDVAENWAQVTAWMPLPEPYNTESEVNNG